MREAMSDQFLRYTEKRRMSESMVEKVARAMWCHRRREALGHRGGTATWEDWADDDKDKWRSLARAAIAAMMEPTEAMTDAATDVAALGEDWMPPDEEARVATRIWQAMISAALSDPAKTEEK